MVTEEFGWGDIPSFSALVERIESLQEEIDRLKAWKLEVELRNGSTELIPVAQVAQFMPRWRSNG